MSENIQNVEQTENQPLDIFPIFKNLILSFEQNNGDQDSNSINVTQKNRLESQNFYIRIYKKFYKSDLFQKTMSQSPLSEEQIEKLNKQLIAEFNAQNIAEIPVYKLNKLTLKPIQILMAQYYCSQYQEKVKEQNRQKVPGKNQKILKNSVLDEYPDAMNEAILCTLASKIQRHERINFSDIAIGAELLFFERDMIKIFKQSQGDVVSEWRIENFDKDKMLSFYQNKYPNKCKKELWNKVIQHIIKDHVSIHILKNPENLFLTSKEWSATVQKELLSAILKQVGKTSLELVKEIKAYAQKEWEYYKSGLKDVTVCTYKKDEWYAVTRAISKRKTIEQKALKRLSQKEFEEISKSIWWGRSSAFKQENKTFVVYSVAKNFIASQKFPMTPDKEIVKIVQNAWQAKQDILAEQKANNSSWFKKLWRWLGFNTQVVQNLSAVIPVEKTSEYADLPICEEIEILEQEIKEAEILEQEIEESFVVLNESSRNNFDLYRALPVALPLTEEENEEQDKKEALSKQVNLKKQVEKQIKAKGDEKEKQKAKMLKEEREVFEKLKAKMHKEKPKAQTVEEKQMLEKKKERKEWQALKRNQKTQAKKEKLAGLIGKNWEKNKITYKNNSKISKCSSLIKLMPSHGIQP